LPINFKPFISTTSLILSQVLGLMRSKPIVERSA